jgi:hypothetical protein
MPAPASAESVGITVRVIQAGPSTSLPSVLFRSGGVITLPSGNDTVAITIGGLNVGGLNSRGHQPRELSFNNPGSPWDKWLLKALRAYGRANGDFGASPVDSSVAADFSDVDSGDSNPGRHGSGGGDSAALDRTIAFAGGSGILDGSGAGSVVALLLAVVNSNGVMHVRPLFAMGLNGNGNLLGNDSEPIANPEPTSMLLLGTGLAGLAAIRRRRSRTSAPADV